ncbi:unnamed protein product [Trichogramma brassicae]|uniref:Uncharacterized protein n=1 Tax=Trichogramma brassicae TaxID=86971 RepID=A0A6H5IZL6_9HYME|nr:unnamed protein product [Trichogramma brassicae]
MSNNEENDAEQIELLGKVNLEKLKGLREKVNWESEEERREFFKELGSLVKNWKGPYPDLRKIFRPEEIDWILSEDVRNLDDVGFTLDRVSIMTFVINCGYRDEPELDKDGKPLLRRTTPLHIAGRLSLTYVLSVYFARIYDRFDANYIDDVGCTHFHVVCTHGYIDFVERFLESGQDPNLVLESTGESPLHMALKWGHNDVAMLLLKKGANVNLANRDGVTPLHLISDRDFYYENDDNTFFKEFFKFIKDQHQTIQIEAKDKWGRAPLEWAVTSFMPDLVDVSI